MTRNTTLVEISAGLRPPEAALAAVPNPSRGRFLTGVTRRARTSSGFELLEVECAAGLSFPDYLQGHALLIYGIHPADRPSAPSPLYYLPPGAPQKNPFETGARCLVVAIPPETLKRIGLAPVFEAPEQIGGLPAEWLVRRLVCEFYRDDSLSPVALEGIVLQLLVEAGRDCGRAASSRRVPRWLHAARQYAEANCLRSLRHSEIAAVVGVHRIHLAREFRRHYAVTIGEFITQRRLEQACRLLSETEDSLADIAIACGYSDQSHFGAIFRRNIGLTPARFRNVAQLESIPAPLRTSASR